MKDVLVIAAHPDDELLGEGGTIRCLANQGVCCRALILGEGLTSRENRREDTDHFALENLKADARTAAKLIGYSSVDFCDLPDNRFDSMDLLDIVKQIGVYLEKYNPDTIFTHHHGDLNIDHRRTCEAVLTACRPVGNYHVQRIYAFETPSSTEWNYIYAEPFRPNVYFEITSTLVAKVQAMACYRSESTTFPHPRSGQALKALAEYRGSTVGMQMAESFMLLRETILDAGSKTINSSMTKQENCPNMNEEDQRIQANNVLKNELKNMLNKGG